MWVSISVLRREEASVYKCGTRLRFYLIKGWRAGKKGAKPKNQRDEPRRRVSRKGMPAGAEATHSEAKRRRVQGTRKPGRSSRWRSALL